VSSEENISETVVQMERRYIGLNEWTGLSNVWKGVDDLQEQ
jgi:hypothetical protein